MGNQNQFKGILERIREAEQLLIMGVERGNLSPIERDLILEKLRKSYELLLFEKSEESIKVTEKQVFDQPVKRVEVEPVLEIPSKIIKPEVEPVPVEPKKDVKPIVAREQQRKEAEKQIEVTKKDISIPEIKKGVEMEVMDDKELIIEEENVEPIESSESQSSGKQQSEILGEKFQGRRKFRNETLSSGKKDMATKLQNKPIEDLTKSIGINDKFMFTKELFHGNAELYAKSIAKLNEFTDINEAIFFIQENFSWDAKNEAANQLIELVRRKLMPGY